MIEPLLFAAGVLAGFVSGFAGGGGGIFLAPMLLLMGIPPHSSIATARLGAAGLSIGAFTRFLSSDEIVWKMILPLIAMSIPAAFLGAYLVLSLDPLILERIIGVILLLASVFLLQKKSIQGEGETASKYFSYPLFFLARVAQAAFGAGIGLILSVVYVKCMGMSLRQSNATKRLPGMTVILLTLIIFGIEGVINYNFGLILMMGSFIGGYIGAHISLSVDQKYIAYSLSALAALFGVYLIF